MSSRIYFDNSATTPVDPLVSEQMKLFLTQNYGNPSSMHQNGREVKEAMEKARRQVAELLNVETKEIIFTGSGTESDNLALVGIFETFSNKPFHMITTQIEHPAILETCRYLERRGASVTYLPVDPDGMVDPDDLEATFQPQTRLVSIMTANNVVGTIQPIHKLAEVVHLHGAFFHTDAVQAVGRLPLGYITQSVDLLSVSAHKLYGPKGIGALYIREGITLEPLIHGGGQEYGRRSSTENVPGIIGFGIAAELASRNITHEVAYLVQLRERLIRGVKTEIENAYLIGHPHCRLPGHVCLGFSGLEGEAIKLLLALDQEGIAVSAGSACSSNHASEPSYVLKALGFDPFRARGGLRITLGRFNTEVEVDEFLHILPKVIGELRPISSRAV